MRNFAITLVTLLTLTFSAEALAAGPVFNDEGARVDNSGSMRELTFDDGEDLEGEVLRLDESILHYNRGRDFNSLISIKMHFIPQLIKLSLDAPFA